MFGGRVGGGGAAFLTGAAVCLSDKPAENRTFRPFNDDFVLFSFLQVTTCDNVLINLNLLLDCLHMNY